LKVVLQADAATLSTPRPGQICVSGTIPDLGADKFAQLSLVFLLSRRDLTGTCMLSAFDPYAFGIAALSFDIDRIPDALVYLGFSAIQAPECPGDNGACTKDGIYDWVTPDRQQIVELSPGTIVAPLDDFVGDTLPEPMSAHWISHFEIDVITGAELPVEFCVSDIQFLDADGEVVAVPGLE
jgi:hypothetical protein